MSRQWRLRNGDVLYPLGPGRHVIGRSPDVEIPLDDVLASRRHAELEVSEAGVRIRDLGSRNGLVVGREAVADGTWRSLADTDLITIGSTRLVVLEHRPRGEHDTAPARPSIKRTMEIDGAVQTSSAATWETFFSEADRAADRGDLGRLESATDLLLDTLSASVGQGMPVADGVVGAAIGHALTLAERRGPVDRWLARVLRLAASTRFAMPVLVVERVERLLGSPTDEVRGAVGAYVDSLRDELQASPRGRALLAQLERLRRASSRAPG